MAPVEATINEILISPHANPIAPGIKLTFMQQLVYGFTLFNSEFKPKEPVTVTNELDRYVMLKHQEKFLFVLAKILMFCDKFACLSFNDKFILFKNSWHIFYQIERHYTSIEYFGKAKEDLRVLLDDKIANDYGNRGFHIKDIGALAINLDHWKPFGIKFIKYLMNPMKDLQLTQYELAFLLSQILWNVQAWEGLSEEAVKVAEQVNEQIAMELHNYYVYEKGIVIYAERLIKLTKLVEAARTKIEVDPAQVRSCLNKKRTRVIHARICLALDFRPRSENDSLKSHLLYI
uniref:NR LBD domain-containing protein n=1 Tax=Acrobeloides nanus TaxID=290746 RepID=A0A914EPY5_9BILA